MRPVSDRFLDAIYKSHEVVSEVFMTTGESLPIVEGSEVTLDITAANRGSADLVIEDPRFFPTEPSSLLAPYGNTFIVKRGIRFPEGDTELVQLGKFDVQEAEVDDEGEIAQLHVNGRDRSQFITDAAFEADFVIAGGTDYLTAIADGIGAVDASLVFDFIERDADCPELHAEKGDDRWAFYQDMAAAIGCDLYYDNDGVLVLRPVASPTNTSVTSLVEGNNGLEIQPALLGLNSKWTREEAHNKWFVTGDNPDVDGPPPEAVAVDDDPNSPTHYGGKFGIKPDFYSSSFILDSTQAKEAAEGRKAKEMGTTKVIDFGSLVNPALEPNDVAYVLRTYRNPLDSEDVIQIANENHIFDSLTIPLDADQRMSGTTRAMMVTSHG